MFSAELNSVINSFAPVHLDDLENFRLMSRIDTKFLMTIDRLPYLLSEIVSDYKILEIGENRIFRYNTNYFDTREYSFFMAHVTGKLVRHKVRFREYEINGKTFLEIKSKIQNNRTVKRRIEADKYTSFFDEKYSDFIKKHTQTDAVNLMPVLSNTFKRITLAGNKTNERITIDHGLFFSTMNGSKQSLPFLAVVEVKTEGFPKQTPIVSSLRKMNIRPQQFSKYCIGTALLRKDTRNNILKSQLLLLNKLKNEYSEFHNGC